MSESETEFYRFQTEARGLTDPAELERTFAHWARWYAKRLGSLLPRDPDARIVDVPCGYGNVLWFLRGQGFRNVRGFDTDPEQVKLARTLELPAEVGDAFSVLESEEGTLDAIFSVDFIEHVSRDDAVRFLRLAYRALRPGGVLLVRTPSADGPFGSHDIWNDLTHKWGLSSNALISVLRMVGFEEVRILDERPQPYNVLGAVRLAVFLAARAVANGVCMALGLIPPRVWSRSMWGVGLRRN